MARGRRTVRAAGGVIWRSRGGELEVVLIHRPDYKDWSLPKGKLDRGETHKQAALREIEEETGLVCTLGPKLPPQTYRLGSGRTKRVKYWLMEPIAGSVEDKVPDREVDKVRWMPFEKALRKASYDIDRDLLRLLPDHLAAAGVTGVAVPDSHREGSAS